jgi:hypothetical protein
MDQNKLSQEDRYLHFVHEQLKLNIVIDVLNYNGPISEHVSLDDDDTVSSAY